MMSMRCHACGHHHGAAVSERPEAARSPFMTVDMHCHLLVPEVDARVAGHPARQAELARIARDSGAASVKHNAGMREAIAGRLTELGQRVQDMDRLGIDLQLLSPSPTQYHAWADEALAAELVALQNQAIAAACRAQPERFVGLAAVALQHPALATLQLREAVRGQGLLGAEISSDPTGRGLDDEALEPFWAEAASLGAVVFIHPLGTSLGERLDRYYLANLIGQPLETTVALSQLIFGGVLDRHPSLKVVAAHGGGYLPHAVGRSDHGFGVRPEAAGCREVPSRYLRRMWFDTIVYRADALHTLVRVAGVDRIVAGTDYPFDMGEYELHGLLQQTGLSEAELARILGRNALELLGLDHGHPAVRAAAKRQQGASA